MNMELNIRDASNIVAILIELHDAFLFMYDQGVEWRITSYTGDSWTAKRFYKFSGGHAGGPAVEQTWQGDFVASGMTAKTTKCDTLVEVAKAWEGIRHTD